MPNCSIQRRVFGVELDAAHQRRLEAVGEAHHALVLVFGVDPDLREVGVDLVAQHALHQVEVVIDQRRRLAVLGAGLDLGPQMFQEADVGAQIFFLDVGGGGANDESAQAVFALAGDDALQALALLVGGDLARDADVVDRRHVDQEAAGQRDVAGDARALLADGLLGNLDQHLLPFLQQIGDERLIAVAVGTGARVAARATAAAAIAKVPATEAGTLGGALLISRSGRCGAQLGATVGLFFFAVLFLFFAFLVRCQDVLASLFGGNNLVFVNVFNLGNPAS